MLWTTTGRCEIISYPTTQAYMHSCEANRQGMLLVQSTQATWELGDCLAHELIAVIHESRSLREHVCIHTTHHYTDNTHTHTAVKWPLVRENQGRPVPEETLPLTPILIIGHPLSSSSIYNNQWHPLCSVYVIDSPLVQLLWQQTNISRCYSRLIARDHVDAATYQIPNKIENIDYTQDIPYT